jgi:uncharacterized membrane protein YbhN (UPF0104 family)
VGLVVLVALIALFVWGWHRSGFSFPELWTQLAQAEWWRIGLALGCIYAGYLIRSVRWEWLLRHNKRVAPFSLVGTQVMGFTAVALVGRFADLVRPYLVAKRTQTPVSSQIAVYIVERLSDAGAMALIFSAAIVFTAPGAMPHAELVKRAGYWGLAGTAGGALFLTLIRLGGDMVATVFERTLGVISKKLGQAVGHKIRVFRVGLDTIRSFSDFAVLVVLSLVMWVVITAAYLETMLAFVSSPELAAMTPAKSVLLMAVSGGASLVQLPVVGWFSQIGFVAAAITKFFGASLEASVACSATLLVVSFLGIVPVGLAWAQFEHVSLRRVARESEQAKEEVESGSGADVGM